MEENKNGFEQEPENNEDEIEEAGMVIRADYIEEEPETVEAEIVSEADMPKKEEEEEEPTGKGKKKKDPMREILEWVLAIALAFVLTFVLKTFVFDIVLVNGSSMESTLQNGERLFMFKMGYKPQRGDIVVLDAHYKAREAYFDMRRADDPSFNGFDEFVTLRLQGKRAKSIGIDELHYVKRVIALEGDVVDIRTDGSVWVNGEKLEETYLDEGLTTPRGSGIQYPYTVEQGHVFVMGDNRHNSTDSRYDTLGAVPVEALYGKVLIRLWSFESVYE